MGEHRADVEIYIDGVLTGTIPTGRLVRLAVERQVMDLELGESRGLWFDEEAANGAIDFFPLLRHSTGEYAGQPFEPRCWQKFIVWCLFGWKRSDGSRRFRDALISVARGNGKSPIGAALGLQLFCMDQPREPRAEVYCCATKLDQAKIVFEEAKRMVEASGLRRIVDVLTLNMNVPDNGSRFMPLGSDSKNTDGLVIHGVIRDELHEWREKHRGLYDKIETAMGKRRQPMAITITTAGDDTSELWLEQHDYSRKVVEQVISKPDEWFGDDHFSYIAEIDKDDDIFDESNWPKANPMLLEPQSPVKIDHLRSMAAKAKAGDIISENRFRRYHCNQLTANIEKPITPELWKRGNGALTVADGAIAYAGIDLARTNDFSAVTLVFPMNGEYEVKTWVWTCEDRPDELKSQEFLNLMKCENLFVHPGNQIDFSQVRAFIVRLSKQYRVKSWAYDPNWARETGQFLATDYGLTVFEFTQAARYYNEPVCKFLSLLSEGGIRHGGCPLLRWQAFNLILTRNAQDLRMPDKVTSKFKIDSMVALFMGLSEALFAEKTPPSVYETRGLLVIG